MRNQELVMILNKLTTKQQAYISALISLVAEKDSVALELLGRYEKDGLTTQEMETCINNRLMELTA